MKEGYYWIRSGEYTFWHIGHYNRFGKYNKNEYWHCITPNTIYMTGASSILEYRELTEKKPDEIDTPFEEEDEDLWHIEPEISILQTFKDIEDVFNFGKHKGCSFGSVCRDHFNYVKYLDSVLKNIKMKGSAKLLFDEMFSLWDKQRFSELNKIPRKKKGSHCTCGLDSCDLSDFCETSYIPGCGY